MDFIKEACVDTVKDAVHAFNSGADRIEFCSNLDEDGLTPKTDDLILIKKLVSIPIRVMIRPHSKSFVYNEMDIEIMKNTIDLCKQFDFDGVVFGCLNRDNELNMNLIKDLANYAKPLNVIIHKAIDITLSPVESLKKLIKLKTINGVLSSGGAANAEMGSSTLKQMVKLSPKNFEIIVAGKVTNINLELIHKKIGSSFYHGRKIVGEL